MSQVVAQIREMLAGVGDPARAVQQQAYMKSALPYRGVTKPELARLLRPILASYRPADRDTWESDVRELWDGVAWREEWYAALALLDHRTAGGWLDADVVPLLRHLIITGGWWDVVDEIATHPVQSALAADPGRLTPVLRGWAADEHLWLRRASVIAQVGRREATDLDLLVLAIEANLDDSSFWLRKAIGWSLRDHARTDPDWVRGQVEHWGPRLPNLSRREALKHLA